MISVWLETGDWEAEWFRVISMCCVQMPTSNSLNPFSTNRQFFFEEPVQKLQMWTLDILQSEIVLSMFYTQIYNMRTSNVWIFHSIFILFEYYLSQVQLNLDFTIVLNIEHNHICIYFTKNALAPPRHMNHSIRKRKYHYRGYHFGAQIAHCTCACIARIVRDYNFIFWCFVSSQFSFFVVSIWLLCSHIRYSINISKRISRCYRCSCCCLLAFAIVYWKFPSFIFPWRMVNYERGLCHSTTFIQNFFSI